MKSNNNNSNQLFQTKKHQIILFVDDEQNPHHLIRMMLHDMDNYVIESAYDGEEAIEKARFLEGRIALLLLDVMLPDMSGYEVYKALERDNLLAGVLVIFQTGLIGYSAEITGLLKAGKAEIIHKPYNRAELFAAINRLQHKYGL